MISHKSRSFRTALLTSAAAISAAASLPANAAQTAAAPTSIEEIIVTGSRIPQQNLESISPNTVISAADFKSQGVTRVEDMINSLPQAFAAQGGQLSNGSTGTATVNLRGLGATRTMVLIDGRRLMPGTSNTSGASLSADLNFIPAALVQRVDILTGGASAVYGADAVAGVVNFVMLRDFEGVRLDGQYGSYQHSNGNPVAAVIAAKAAGSPTPELFALPKKNVWDGGNGEATLIFGTNSADGKGNVTAYIGYRNFKPVLAGNRDYSACTLNSGTSFAASSCGGSGTAYPARVGSFIVDVTTPSTQAFRPRVAARDVYNFGPSNYFQRPDNRYTMGAFSHYEIAPWAEVYADAMFMDDISTYQIAPGGIFAGTWSINCANPLLSAQQRGLMAATAATGGGTCATNRAGTFTGIVGRRNIEGGGRQGQTHHAQYRFVTGVRGDINTNWNYDASLQYGRVSFNQVKTGFFRSSAITNALNVVTGANGQPVCASVLNGTDSRCVPYNIFKIGGVTQGALDYLETDSFDTGSLNQKIATASVSGDLTDYGLKTPWAADGAAVSFGTEYRKDALASSSDFVSSAGLLNGAGGASPPVNGSFNVSEFFAETRVPVIQDQPMINSLKFEGAYRWSNYTSAGVTHTFKLGGDYEPVDDLRLRGTYQRAVRAPHVIELFSPRNVVLDGSQDPCAGLAASNPKVARCASAFGLTTARVLAIEANPANQYNGLTGGNPSLAPETSDTKSLGFILTPTAIPGFNFSADWFDIKVKDYIDGIGADLIINRCVDTLDPFFCNLVRRDAAGSIWLSEGGYVIDTTLNTGALRTRGIDFNAGYTTELDNLGIENGGSISASFVGTYLASLKTQSLPGDAFYDCAGYYGTICDVPNPEWRHKMRLTWNPSIGMGGVVDEFGISLQWRYFASVKLDALSADKGLTNPGLVSATDAGKSAQSYFDLTATFTVMERVKARIGVNNLLDRDPPLNGSSNCPTGPCNGNTWPQVYDALGRYLFAGATIDF